MRRSTISLSTHPDRNGALHRQGIEAGAIDVVPLASIGHHRLRPEGPHHRDLFLDAGAAGAEILAQGLELHAVPPNADTEPKPPAAEDVHLGGLFRRQHRVALWQDQDTRHQLDPPRQRCQVAEQDKHLVEHVLVGVAHPSVPTRHGARDVVVDDEVLVADLFGGAGKLGHSRRAGSDLSLRKDHTDSHAASSRRTYVPPTNGIRTSAEPFLASRIGPGVWRIPGAGTNGRRWQKSCRQTNAFRRGLPFADGWAARRMRRRRPAPSRPRGWELGKR